MNLLDSNLFLTYLNAILLIIFISLWLLNSTKRHREWLLKSFVLGLFIGPLLLISTKSLSFLNEISLLSGNLSIFEAALMSGLSWAIASSWLISLRFLPPVSSGINVQWLRVVAFMMAIIATVFIAHSIKIDSGLALLSILGLVSIILSMRNVKLLLLATLSGTLFATLGIVGTYAGALMNQDVALGQLTFTTVALLIQPSYLALFGIIALSAPIVSRWWFDQPSTPQT